MNLWTIPLWRRRALVSAGAVCLTGAVAGFLAPGFFVGEADWLVALGGALLAGLCLFGHFAWLLWMIGFIGWKSRPKDVFSKDEAITTRTSCPSITRTWTGWLPGFAKLG
jgi:hypothetical protein